MKINNLYFLLLLILISCIGKTVTQDTLQTVFEFPKKIKEVSGLVYTEDLIWVIQDKGNSNKIFGFDKEGNILKEISIDDAENIDWEDLTSDKNGNLYIGDFGNNNNDRQDLTIYKLSASDFTKVSEKITFYYPEQIDFPAKKREKLYDCEAFFLYQNSFYLFTKNRSKGFDGMTLLYKVPNITGHHPAQLIGKFITCPHYNSCVITGAAISPDEKKVVLLGHDRVWLLENFEGEDFLSGTITTLNLKHYSQKEAIGFKDNEILFIADERSKKVGGKLYTTTLSILKGAN